MRRRHHTFHFSPFTFQFINMRRRHHTFHFSPFTFQFFDDGTMRKWDDEKNSHCPIVKKKGPQIAAYHAKISL